MTDETTRNTPEAQEATILIVDIVGYSDLPGPDQLAAVERLAACMRATEVIRRSSHNEVFFLPTGDGVVVGFLGLPERPLELASQLHTLYKDDRFLLKIGIHSGYIFPYVDIKGNWNYAGSSINLAQRVESCCNSGHILVAQPSPERLQDLSRWSGYFRGPYTFRVKHGRELRAYNFVDDERGIGNPAEPIGPFRVIQPTHTTLPARLATLGVVPIEELRTNSMRRILADRLAIEDAILDSPIRGFAGVLSSQIEIEITHEPPPLPDVVLEAKSQIAEPTSNRKKVYLADWVAPVSDQGDILHLKLGRTEYWNAVAIENSLQSLYTDIRRGTLDLFRLPRQLNCHILVITSDSKLLLARRSKGLRYRPLTWGATIGESMDANRDLNQAGLFDPSVTVEQALSEKEELGLHVDARHDKSVKFIALLTEWHLLIAVLIAVVKLWKTEAAKVKELCMNTALDQGEIIDIDAVDFTIDACLPIVVTGHHRPAMDGEKRADAVYGTSRMAILAALSSEYGYPTITDGLEQMKKGFSA